MKKIEEKISEAVRKALPRMGEGYRNCAVGGNTQVSRGFSLAREPRVAVKLYDTHVVCATGTPSDYTLDIDAGYFSATTRSRVNAALDGLGVALTLRSRDGDPAYFDGEGREIAAVRRAFCPSFHVVGGKVVLT